MYPACKPRCIHHAFGRHCFPNSIRLNWKLLLSNNDYADQHLPLHNCPLQTSCSVLVENTINQAIALEAKVQGGKEVVKKSTASAKVKIEGKYREKNCE